MGEIEESMKLIIQTCLKCNHSGKSHMKEKPLSNPQGRLRGPPLKTIFTKCNECNCQQFEPKK